MAILRSSSAVGVAGVAATGAAPASPLLPSPAVRRSLVVPSYVVETMALLMYEGLALRTGSSLSEQADSANGIVASATRKNADMTFLQFLWGWERGLCA